MKNNPRVGVIGGNEVNWEFFDDMGSWIDLGWEDYMLELQEQGVEEDSDEWYAATDNFESSGPYLIGAWSLNENGKYFIDKNSTETYAAVYNSDTNVITVEWSKHTKQCGGTSPCYVMADGSGPCGDLTSSGNLIAYNLPEDSYFQDDI